jgi:isoquinoline 1-oxidoreductase beta subunit
MRDAHDASRRRFIVAGATAAGGLAIGIDPFGAIAVVRAAQASPEITPWVVIQRDDTVVVRIARSEMGQGAITGLAQLVAEELECDWNSVTWEYPSPAENLARNRVWGDFDTGGSYSIWGSHEFLRKAGAAARVMLIQAAANGWNVPAAECTVDKGVISHSAWGRRTTYGQVALAASRLDVPKDVALKDPKDWRIIGKPLKRLDTIDKLTGKQVYAVDLRLPGMLNAAIKACPVFGGTVRSIDASSAERMRGVKKVVRVGDDAVAVVADTWWHANTALDAVHVEWDGGERVTQTSASIDAMLQEALGAQQTFVDHQAGDSNAGIAGATTRIEAIYDYPFQNHACMEPMSATALCTADRCEVWCPTQDGEAALDAAAEAAGLPASQCDAHKIQPGGGFGRRQRGYLGYVTQAVLIAKTMPGTPIKLLWSREEDMTRAHYHPVTKARLSGGLDADGNVTGLAIRLAGPSILAAVEPKALDNGKDFTNFLGLRPVKSAHSLEYTVANLTIDHAMRGTHVPPGTWRAVSGNQNAIFLECFIDELAYAAGRDALEFRRKLMKDHPKSLAVLEAVASKGGWSDKAPAGRHRGLAAFRVHGSSVAALAEISVEDANAIRVHRIVVGLDCGYAVNPAQIERQIAGSVVWGLSALFLQECTVRDGRIEQENFDTYDSMRIAQMPMVESIIMPSGGFWGGVGEPPTCVAPPAVLNAYFAATGKRIRSFPLKKHGIRMV